MTALEHPLPLPFSGLPLPGRNNPIVVLPSPRKASVKAEITSMGCIIEGLEVPGLSSILCTYKSRLEEALGERIGIRLEVSMQEPVPRASLIALLTLAMLEAVEREAGYSFTLREKLEYTSILDAATGYKGWKASLLQALRRASLESAPLVHRSGEGTVVLPEGIIAEAVECMDFEYTEPRLDKHVADALTRLAGLVTLRIADDLRRGAWESLREHWRVEDGLWYSAWGVKPRHGYKTAADLGGVCLVEPKVQ